MNDRAKLPGSDFWVKCSLLLSLPSWQHFSQCVRQRDFACRNFPLDIREIGMDGTGRSLVAVWLLASPSTFLLLALLGLIALAFVWRFLPKTRQKSLGELEEKQLKNGHCHVLKMQAGEKQRTQRRKTERTLSKIEEEERDEKY
uniref:Integrin beta-7 n=1 Tax=Globodera pallida TaxID=36090 RepID=A0A183CHM9_GLOPA